MNRLAVAAVTLIAMTSVASAQHRHREHRHQRQQHWVAPMIGGLLLGGAVAGAYGYYQPRYRQRVCWDEPVYGYNRRGYETIIAYDRICE